MSLANALERAAEAFPKAEDVIRPANGDAQRVLDGVSPAVASEILRWLLVEEVSASEELVAAWCEGERGMAIVAEIDPASLPKAARKVIRRARHRLRSRGVDVSEAVPEVVATLPQIEDKLGGSYLSFPDPSGAQMAVHVEPGNAGGARILQAIIDFERGVLEFVSHDANRSAGRKLLRELSQASRSGFASLSSEAWAGLLARAAEAQSEDRPLPMGYAESRGRFAGDPGVPAAAFANLIPQGGVSAEPALLRKAVEWVGEGRVGPWPPKRSVLEAAGEGVRQALQSRLLVDDAQRRRQVDVAIGDCLRERYAEQAGEQTALRFDSAAYIFSTSKQDEEVVVCLAAAKAFREIAPEDNPVARALLSHSLEPLLREWKEEEAASLIARP